jgi:periplasmic protein TonB
VKDPNLPSAVAASILIHLLSLPLLSLFIDTRPTIPIHVPIELVETVIQATEKLDLPSPPPQRRPLAPVPKKTQTITAPKLLSKPEIPKAPQAKDLDKPMEKAPEFTNLPDSIGSPEAGWNIGDKSSEAEGAAGGAGKPVVEGDVGVVPGPSVEGGAAGTSEAGLGRGAKGDGTGGSIGASEPTPGLARPLGGYQVRPRYPESARRAHAEGTTMLKLLVLENGRVGEVLIEQSAGHRDLDMAAADAVKKWLFEPARRGKEPVAVWVLLPVKFELQ